MSAEPEEIIGAFMVFLVIVIAGWMMLDIDIARPIGMGWLFVGVLGVVGIITLVIAKILGES